MNELLPDTQQIGVGVIVGCCGWDQQLEQNRQNFLVQYMFRSRFDNTNPTSMTPAEYVDRLFANTGIMPTPTERATAIAEFSGAPNTFDVLARARALREIVDNPRFIQQESNRAFVLMEYLGYLRRNPNDAPDLDYTGYDFWLAKLNQFNGNFIQAQMVKAFISSTEYRGRFGS